MGTSKGKRQAGRSGAESARIKRRLVDGLWAVTPAAQLVDIAEQHLDELLSDPYYVEAVQRIRRRPKAEQPPALHARTGRPRSSKGEIAGEYQWGAAPGPGGKGARAEIDPERRLFFKLLEKVKQERGVTLISICRKKFDDEHPRKRKQWREDQAQKLAERLRNEKKKVLAADRARAKGR